MLLLLLLLLLPLQLSMRRRCRVLRRGVTVTIGTCRSSGPCNRTSTTAATAAAVLCWTSTDSGGDWCTSTATSTATTCNCSDE